MNYKNNQGDDEKPELEGTNTRESTKTLGGKPSLRMASFASPIKALKLHQDRFSADLRVSGIDMDGVMALSF